MEETSNGRNTDTVIALRFKANFIEKKTVFKLFLAFAHHHWMLSSYRESADGSLMNQQCTTKECGGWCLFSDQREKKISPEVLVFRKNHTLVCQGDRALLDFPVFSCLPHLLPPLIRIYK